MPTDLDKIFGEETEDQSAEADYVSYSEKVLDRCFNPRNWGMIENPQHAKAQARSFFFDNSLSICCWCFLEPLVYLLLCRKHPGREKVRAIYFWSGRIPKTKEVFGG